MKNTLLTAAVIIIILLGGSSLYFYQKSKHVQSPASQNNQSTPTSTPQTAVYKPVLFELKQDFPQDVKKSKTTLLSIDPSTGKRSVKYESLNEKLSLPAGQFIFKQEFDHWRNVYYFSSAIYASDSGVTGMYEYNPVTDTFKEVNFKEKIDFNLLYFSPVGRYAVSFSQDSREALLVDMETKSVSSLAKLTKSNETYAQWETMGRGFIVSWNGLSEVSINIFDSTQQNTDGTRQALRVETVKTGK